MRVNERKRSINRPTHEVATTDARSVGHLIFPQNLGAAVLFWLGIGSMPNL